MRLALVRALGFDESAVLPFGKGVDINCSQCQAVVVNNVPTHERGCPNARHECAGCNALIPARQKYCSDCQ